MTGRTPFSAVVCARGPGGLDAEDHAALVTAAVRFMETRCQAPSQTPVPPRSQRDKPRTYHCGLPAGHAPEDGHRWPPDPTSRLIVAWCDWPRP